MATHRRPAPPESSSTAPHSDRSSRLLGAREPIAALNRIRITETGLRWQDRDPLVDIRAFCPDVVVVERTCPYLRRTVAEMLNRAQALAPHGTRLRVGTALRTLAMQKDGWDRYYERVQLEHPGWSYPTLRRATNRYFAPYDQKAPPGHCTGAAVDVYLLNEAGEILDMTAPTTGWKAAYTWSEKISPEARTNRMRMVDAMLAAGFSNCRDEYWHYSWGDSAWAVRVGQSACPYGWAYAPPTLVLGSNSARSSEHPLTVEREFDGRPLRAQYAEVILLTEADDGPNSTFRIGINWCRGIPVTLRLATKDDRLIHELYLGDGKDQWSRIPIERDSSGVLTVNLTPEHDIVQLATAPPAVTSEN